MRTLVEIDNIKDLKSNWKIHNSIKKEVWSGAEVATNQEKQDFIVKETWRHYARDICKIENSNTNDVLDSNFKVR